jgi:hypothetical protein
MYTKTSLFSIVAIAAAVLLLAAGPVVATHQAWAWGHRHHGGGGGFPSFGGCCCCCGGFGGWGGVFPGQATPFGWFHEDIAPLLFLFFIVIVATTPDLVIVWMMTNDVWGVDLHNCKWICRPRKRSFSWRYIMDILIFRQIREIGY